MSDGNSFNDSCTVFRMRSCAVALGILFYVHLVCDTEGRSKKSKYVTTLLEAKWEVTPLVLEVAEYLADENVDFYWSFIDSISSLSPSLVEIGKNLFLCLPLIYNNLSF